MCWTQARLQLLELEYEEGSHWGQNVQSWRDIWQRWCCSKCWFLNLTPFWSKCDLLWSCWWNCREGLQLAHLVNCTGRLAAVDMVEVLGSLISILRQQMIHSLCFHILMVDSCLNRWTLAWPNLSETLSGQLKLQAASFLLPLVFASSHLCDLLPVLRTASVEHLQNSLLYSLNMNDS